MADKSKLARDTYREPDMPKRCETCFRSGYCGEGCWLCDLLDEAKPAYGTCDAWESDDG